MTARSSRAERELPPEDESFCSFVLAGMRRPAIWEWPTWSEARPALDSLVALSGVPGAVRSVQADRSSGAQARFGRLIWSDKSDRRWVIGAPGGDAAERSVFFTEIWAPGWNVCARQRGAPFLLIGLENPHILSEPRADQFNQLVHVALPVAMLRAHAGAVSEAIAMLARAIGSVLEVYRLVPFYRGSDSVQDALNNHFQYQGRWNDAVPDLTRLRTPWTRFEADGRDLSAIVT